MERDKKKKVQMKHRYETQHIAAVGCHEHKKLFQRYVINQELLPRSVTTPFSHQQQKNIILADIL